MTLMQRRRALMAVKKTNGKSDMNGWTDGVAYTDLEIVKNQYVDKISGEFRNSSGWDRTGYVPCEGASSITFPPMPQQYREPAAYNLFYSSIHGGVSGFTLSKTDPTTIAVPPNSAYFVISTEAAALESCINGGIVPHK